MTFLYSFKNYRKALSEHIKKKFEVQSFFYQLEIQIPKIQVYPTIGQNY